MADQTEKAFQKQPSVVLNRKSGNKKKLRLSGNIGRVLKLSERSVKDIYKKCPFTGNVSIRGRRILIGVVQKMKMQRTIIVHYQNSPIQRTESDQGK